MLVLHFLSLIIFQFNVNSSVFHSRNILGPFEKNKTYCEHLLVDKVFTSQHKTCRMGVSGLEGKFKVKSSILFNKELCTTNTPDGK